LVSKGREVKGGSGSDPLSRLGKKLKKPFSSDTYVKAFVRYIMMLPLNFIPVVGTVIFIVLQGIFILMKSDMNRKLIIF